MFFPESNPVIPPGTRDPVALVPDYNAVVEVLPLGATAGDMAGSASGRSRRASGGAPRVITVGREATSMAPVPIHSRRRDARGPSTSDGATLPVPDSTGVVLAGGRSLRFGRDKLLEPFDEGLLVHHAVLALAGICSEVLVVIPPLGAAPPMPPSLPVPVRIVRDREAHGGPLLGLIAAAAAAEQQYLVVAGGDMPQLQPAVLRAMLRRAAGIGDGEVAQARPQPALAVTLEDGGERRPLPCVLGRASAMDAASDLAAAGQRSLRTLLDALDAAVIPESSWRALDTDGRTLRDVDHPADLAALAVSGASAVAGPPGSERATPAV
jgi:molybdopterin-guanine dinucleotide biosynthesis protein A